MELGRETKSIGSNEEYFRAMATPNGEKPKEEEEDEVKTLSVIYRGQKSFCQSAGILAGIHVPDISSHGGQFDPPCRC